MSKNINLTNPENPPDRKKPRKLDWNWRDEIAACLTQQHNVPVSVAMVAMIDLRESLETCDKSRLSAQQTANLLICEIQTVYNKGNPYASLG